MEGKDQPKLSGPPEDELSRDDVRAQREAKRLAKAARKSKTSGKADGPEIVKDSGSALNVKPKPSVVKPEKTPKYEAAAEPIPKVETTTTPESIETTAPEGEMSREDVMAQRAEKKKLKEARKNKGVGGPSAENEQVQKPDAAQQKQSQSEAGKGQKNEKPQEQEKSADTTKSNKQQQKQRQPTGKEAAPAKVVTKDPKEATPQPTRETPGTDPSTASATDLKAVSVEKSSGKVEYQSTIHSLFRLKKTGESAKESKFKLHPLFHNLGVKLRNNVIRGTNLKCIRLLHTIKEYVECYETPAGTTLKHSLSEELRCNLDNLRRNKCPFAIGMNNAVDFVNAFLFELPEANDEIQQKMDILDMIDTYIEEKIEKAVEAIVVYGQEKIKTGDVLMIYSVTEALIHLLQKAAESDSFELIIIQTPENMPDLPLLLSRLSDPIKNRTVTISTVNFSNAIYRMRHCSKIIIGGHGLFTTGGVMAQSGSGKLALLANTYNKPAVFLCETYKFCDRSPLDFFTLDEYVPEHSEIEDDLFEPKIMYDVTPANLVTVVITDIDVLPSTSVPVVLRVQEGRSPRKYTTESAPADTP